MMWSITEKSDVTFAIAFALPGCEWALILVISALYVTFVKEAILTGWHGSVVTLLFNMWESPSWKKKNRDNFFSKVDWLNQAFIDQNQFFLPEGDGDEVIEENNNEKKTSGESYDFFNTQMGLTKKDVNLLSKFILCSFMLRDCVWDCKMHKYAPLISMVLFTWSDGKLWRRYCNRKPNRSVSYPK